MPITRRRVFGVFAGAAAAVGVPSVWISNMKTYDGPVSDHFDGMRFFDPDGVPPKSLAEVLRWQFGTDRQRAELAGLGAEPAQPIRRRRASAATRSGCRSSAMSAG